MKRLFIAIFTLFILLNFAGCAVSGGQSSDDKIDASQTEDGANGGQSGNTENPGNTDSGNEEIKTMYLYINDDKLEVTLAANKAVTALTDILKQGDITYMADDYGGFEKVGSLGYSLPTENSQITTEAGDVILYSGNQIVLFYGSNSWSYTRLGKINGYSTAELRALLRAGSGSVQIRISLK